MVVTFRQLTLLRRLTSAVGTRRLERRELPHGRVDSRRVIHVGAKSLDCNFMPVRGKSSAEEGADLRGIEDNELLIGCETALTSFILPTPGVARLRLLSARMLMAKTGPNQPCPCGSGKKHKKCCGGPNAAMRSSGLPHTSADRAAAIQKLDEFIDRVFADEEEDAHELFWGRHAAREEELPPDMLRMANDVLDAWFAFDFELEPGRRPVDAFLEDAELTRGERGYLETMRASTMRFYEVIETVPGVSITFRDLLDGPMLTVAERSASRILAKTNCVGARIIARGASGRPEIEYGVLPINTLMRDDVIRALEDERAAFLESEPGAAREAFYREVPPLFHDAWMTSIFEPPVPPLANTDGEEMILTRVSFHVDDAPALRKALDAAEGEGVTRSGEDAWRWAGTNAKDAEVSLGSLALKDTVLTAEVNSVARGERARALVDRLAGAAIRHRGTTHEDVRRQVQQALTKRALGGSDPDEDRVNASGQGSSAIPPAVHEALVTQHLTRHYRAWVDEPVPALDGKTPRDASRIPAMRPRVADLIRGIEGLYERALKDGQPAYDPSWMWDELELGPPADPASPPPIAHERVYERVPGSEEAARSAAGRVREGALPADDLELQRFVRRGRTSDNDAGAEGVLAAPYIPLLVDFELHRRKVFWVDGPLAYMLESTDLDLEGRELRAPFPSFALVFYDRHALSLGERLLSRREADALRGQILRVLTVYVTEAETGSGRSLGITFAFDALGADLPSLVRHEVPAGDGASLRAFLESLDPIPGAMLVGEGETAPLPDASPSRGLLRLVLNAVLYATSAGVTPEARMITRRHPATRATPAATPSSDSVFFLPGKIDIRRLRQFQEIERAPDGRTLLARFMVRGHWRRPPKNWADQRLRWIEPHWKGPDMAAVIEKAYRLRS